MLKPREYENLGTLITDGLNVLLKPIPGDGEGFNLGDLGNEFIFTLRQELSSYDVEEAKILVTKLDVIIAKRELRDAEEKLAKLEKKKELEAKKKEARA